MRTAVDGLGDAFWARHTSPKSGWTRVPTGAVVVYAVYRRDWRFSSPRAARPRRTGSSTTTGVAVALGSWTVLGLVAGVWPATASTGIGFGWFTDENHCWSGTARDGPTS